MSRPGYPISSTQVITTHNSYLTWQGVTFNGTDQCLVQQGFEDKQGANTPGWPHVVKTNYYLRSKFTWKQVPLTVDAEVDQGSGHIDHSFGEFGDQYNAGVYPWSNYPLGLNDEMDRVGERLIGKLIDDIQRNRVNLGEIAHTRNQTASMLVSTANRFVGTVQSLRKGNFAGAARYLTGAEPRTRSGIRTSKSGRVTSGLGGIPEQWLALQYGWKPLVQDIYNSCEAVHKAWNDNGDLFTANASAKETGEKFAFTRLRNVAWGPDFVIESGQREVSGKASVVFGVDSNIGSSLSQLGITNPASLAWELLPYSFVVDWMYPVGSFLERLDYDRGLVFKHGWLTIKARQDVRQRLAQSSVTSGNITARYQGGSGTGSAFLMVRNPLNSFPPVPVPRIKNPISPTHVANALSLLATAFRGGKIPR